MTASLSALSAYCVQLAILVATAGAAVAVLRLRAPRASLRFWRMVGLAAVLLPLAPAAAEPPPPVIVSAATALTSRIETLVAAGTDWSMSAIAFWLIAGGVGVRLSWLAGGLWRIRRIVARADHHPALGALLDPSLVGCGDRLDIRVTGEIGGPATVGVVHPVILLPRRILHLPAPVQRAAIVHELMHVRRRDWASTVAEEIGCAVMWFHPAVRMLASRLALARETVVDQLTLASTRDRRAYAAALLAFAEPHRDPIGVTSLIGRRSLRQRIALIAKEDSMSTRRTLATLIAAVGLAGAATAYAAVTFPLEVQSRTDVYRPGNGVTLPVVTREVKPKYTPEAMQARIQGTIWLEIVVGEGGDVIRVDVSRSLDDKYGLDREAVAAAKQWAFKPGTKDGKPVPVLVTLEMTFTLKK